MSKNIGIIYQQDNLLPDFTALENVYLASLAVGNEKEFLKKQFLYICKACYLLDIRIIVIHIVYNCAIENINQEKVEKNKI